MISPNEVFMGCPLNSARCSSDTSRFGFNVSKTFFFGLSCSSGSEEKVNTTFNSNSLDVKDDPFLEVKVLLI